MGQDKVFQNIRWGLIMVAMATVTAEDPLFTCDFETDMCGMEQRNNDDFDWTRQSGRTPTDLITGENTGPRGAHVGTYYIYIETSVPRTNGDRAYISTPAIQHNGDICVRFYYNMYGRDIGRLVVFTEQQNESNAGWTEDGDKGGPWLDGKVTVKNFKENDKRKRDLTRHLRGFAPHQHRMRQLQLSGAQEQRYLRQSSQPHLLDETELVQLSRAASQELWRSRQRASGAYDPGSPVSCPVYHPTPLESDGLDSVTDQPFGFGLPEELLSATPMALDSSFDFGELLGETAGPVATVEPVTVARTAETAAVATTAETAGAVATAVSAAVATVVSAAVAAMEPATVATTAETAAVATTAETAAEMTAVTTTDAGGLYSFGEGTTVSGDAALILQGLCRAITEQSDVMRELSASVRELTQVMLAKVNQ